MRWFAVLWMVCVALRPDAGHASEVGAVRDSAVVIAQGRSVRVRVVVQMAPSPSAVEPGEYWGTDGPGGRLVSRIQIRVGRDDIWMPRSSWSDLSDVRRIELQGDSSGVRAILHGSETGLAYVAEFRVRSGRLRARRVSSVEMPQSWERTEYHFFK